MTEAEFTDRIVDLAHTFGWRVAHFRAARTAQGWRTPVAFDGKGWPDLVLCHPEHGVLYREIKTDGGKCSEEQLDWLNDLTIAGADAAVWRPVHWDVTIVPALTGGRALTPTEVTG